MLRISPTYTVCEPPYGPRSQGCVDEDAVAALNKLLALPRITESVWEATDDRVADVFFALHAAAVPDVLVYPDARRAELFKAFMLDLRQRHRTLQSHGKRPWPALMQAAMANEFVASDCDALFALTGVRMVSVSPAGFEVGDAVAGLPLDTPVFDCNTMRTVPLLQALPPVPAVPVLKTASPEKLRRITHEVAAATRVPGASGYRSMTRAEQISETARRIAEGIQNMPITSDPARIAEEARKIYKMNERLLGVMSPQRLFVLSRCIALKMCLGCGWDSSTEDDMGALQASDAGNEMADELGRMRIVT